jgi:mono/diheme cytochrome c family protein
VRRVAFPLAVISAVVLFCAQSGAARADETQGKTATGSTIFQANCLVCHGEDGSGSDVGKSLHAADLRSSTVQTKSNAALAHFIDEGKGAMPAFKDRLDDQQVLDVVRYLRTLRKHHAAQ